MLRGERNLVGELIEAAGRLPWWGAIMLAFVAFVMLHPFAIMEVAPAAPVDDGVALTSKEFWKGLAGTVQYIVPLVFLVAPLVCGIVNRMRKDR
ncbi:MAG TPA: hypothetical protein VIQ62_02655 [Burkholderiales bacterium]|jgi:hypothetical protein